MDHFYMKAGGWDTFENFYTKMAESIPDGGHAAEVGVWQGRSFFFLAVTLHNMKKHVTLFAVDTWQGSSDIPAEKVAAEQPEVVFDRLLAGFSSEYVTVVKMKMPSLTAAEIFSKASTPAFFDFVFIDADHAYEHVKADIAAWLPLLARNGIIAGHDYLRTTTVGKAVHEFVPDERLYTDHSCWCRLPAAKSGEVNG